MTTARKAYVYKSGILAGTIENTQGQTSFTYDQQYLTSAGDAIGASLPLTQHPYVTNAGALPPFFSNLLPEGRRLTALRQSIKTSLDDELSLLLAVGSDTIGDVQVLSHPLDFPRTNHKMPQEKATDFTSVTFTDFFAAQGLIDYVALPGVQDKVSGRMLTVSLPHLGSGYLLKLNPPEFPHLVENEQLFLTHAASLKLRCGISHTKVVHDANKTSALLVSRFDRVFNGGDVSKIPVQDSCQILGIYPSEKYAVSTKEVVQAVMASVNTPLLAAIDIFKQILYAWLTGNGDLHAKNISIYKPGKEWMLTPVYDIPSTAPYGDKSMALKAINDVLKLAPKIAADAQKLPFDSHRAREMQKLLRARAHSLA